MNGRDSYCQGDEVEQKQSCRNAPHKRRDIIILGRPSGGLGDL